MSQRFDDDQGNSGTFVPDRSFGVYGSSNAGYGVAGTSLAGNGVQGGSESGFGVVGTSGASHGVMGIAFGGDRNGAGVFARGQVAGFFEGDVVVTGDIQLTGGDYAEDFDVIDSEAADPGTVMTLDELGAVRVSDQPYDTRAAGVISGAAGHKPAVILDRQGPGTDRRPLALMGKVYCKVDASYDSIAVGDLLTTSATPGHAMKATNREKAFGTIIGKALMPQSAGRGLIPILIALQ